MFIKKNYLAASAIFLTFVCLNFYVIHSILNSKPVSPKLENMSSIVSYEDDEMDIVKYKHFSVPAYVNDKQEQEKSEQTKQETVKYTVKAGDTLWDISSTYNIDISTLINSNNLESPDSLKIGQELILPPPGSAKPSSTVKLASRGDSLISTFTGSYPVSGRLSSRYGKRNGEFHKGIDIAATTGTDVHAFADGKVIFSGWDNGGYGYLVIISHGNGYETYYGHNSKLIIKSGQAVTKGQLIAKVGNTGDSDGSHCHFEVRRNGTPINPLNFIN